MKRVIMWMILVVIAAEIIGCTTRPNFAGDPLVVQDHNKTLQLANQMTDRAKAELATTKQIPQGIPLEVAEFVRIKNARIATVLNRNIEGIEEATKEYDDFFKQPLLPGHLAPEPLFGTVAASQDEYVAHYNDLKTTVIACARNLAALLDKRLTGNKFVDEIHADDWLDEYQIAFWDSPEMEAKVGKIGFLQTVHIIQITPPNQFLVSSSVINRKTAAITRSSFIIEGESTEGFVDDQDLTLTDMMQCDRILSYRTAIGGSSTVFVFRPYARSSKP